MHHLKAFGPAPYFSVTTHFLAARQSLLLGTGEIKEAQSNQAGAISNVAQHDPTTPEGDLSQFDFTLDDCPLT